MLIHTAAPRRDEVLSIFIFALLLRVAVFILALRVGHLSVAGYTSKGDTSSYIANAAAMSSERSYSSLSDYDHRVFPGYPLLIAITHKLGISLSMAALCVTWISAALAAAAGAKVFEDARVGWAMTCLIPHYLINSSLGMSEAPLLAMICVAMLASQKNQQVRAGIAFAFAGIIRPMACFALAGVLLALFQQRRWRAGLLLSITVLVAFTLEATAIQLWTGDALHGIHVYAQHPGAYGGHMLAWPFQSLLTTPGRDGTGAGKIIYIWIHVLITLGACAMISERHDSIGSPGHAKQRFISVAGGEHDFCSLHRQRVGISTFSQIYDSRVTGDVLDASQAAAAQRAMVGTHCRCVRRDGGGRCD